LRWIPLFPSVKARALVEFEKVPATNGLLPIGVPEFDPKVVAALFVDEGVPVGPSNPASIAGAGFICHVNPATPPPGYPAAVAGLNGWTGIVGSDVTTPDCGADGTPGPPPTPGTPGYTGKPISLSNTSNHSVVILASRDTNACI